MNELDEFLEGMALEGNNILIDIYYLPNEKCPKCGKTKCLSVAVSFGGDTAQLYCTECHFELEGKVKK